LPQSNVITFPALAKKFPEFVHGLPKRLKGLRIVSQQTPDTHGGLGMCLEQAAKGHPNTIAVIYENQEYSYREFNQWVNRICDYLRRSGSQKGDVIAVFVENRPELLASIAAIAKLGGVSALVNTSQRGAVLRHSLGLVSPQRVIVGEELMAAAQEVSDVLPSTKDSCLYIAETQSSEKCPDVWVDLVAESKQGNSDNPASTTGSLASEPFCYFYTSGTTGLPKAAILTHGRYMKAYAGVGLASIQLKPSDRAFVTLPFYHGTALVVGWGSVLAGHAGLVMGRQFSASGFWDEVIRSNVTAICYVGELCRYLLAQPESSKDRAHNVRLMFGNGLRPSIWHAFKQRFDIQRVMEFYGSSEGNVGFLNLFNFDCTVGFTTVPYAIVEYDLEQDCPIRYKNGFLKKVRKGQAGLLLGEITDASPFDGYTDPEKTEKTILRNVFKAGDAWFNTGDLMRDQGYRHAQFVDRLGDTFRWKGENVSTTEVENALAAEAAILDAVVYGVEIPETNGRAGMACIRLNEGESFDGKAILDALRRQLPQYAVPVFIRETKELETTGTHKYKKTDLKQAAYDLALVKDPVWVCLPGEHAYSRLSPELQLKLNAGAFRF